MIEQSGKAYTLKCPNSDCKYKIDKSKVQEIVAPDSFKKFQKFMNNYEVAKSPNKKFCPHPGCVAIIEGSKSLTKTKCTVCQKLVCY